MEKNREYFKASDGTVFCREEWHSGAGHWTIMTPDDPCSWYLVINAQKEKTLEYMYQMTNGWTEPFVNVTEDMKVH